MYNVLVTFGLCVVTYIVWSYYQYYFHVNIILLFIKSRCVIRIFVCLCKGGAARFPFAFSRPAVFAFHFFKYYIPLPFAVLSTPWL